jgi:hypothetical protein
MCAFTRPYTAGSTIFVGAIAPIEMRRSSGGGPVCCAALARFRRKLDGEPASARLHLKALLNDEGVNRALFETKSGAGANGGPLCSAEPQ